MNKKVAFQILIVTSLAVFFFSSVRSSGTQKTYYYEDLPTLVMVCHGLLLYPTDFLKTNEWNTGETFVHKILSQFAGINCNMEIRMGMTHFSRIVESELSSDPNEKCLGDLICNENALYVSRPVKSLGNSVIIAISSVRPERTTILSLNENLSVKLLYDTHTKRTSDLYVCSIETFETIGTGKFVALERNTGRCVPKDMNRRIYIDVSNGEFTISTYSDWP